MGMLVLLALCPANSALAQEECDALKSCTTKNGWTVTLMEGYPTEVPNTDIYEWRY